MALNTIVLTDWHIKDFQEKCYNADKREIDSFKIISHYSDSSEGSYRIFQLLKNSCKWSLILIQNFNFKEDFKHSVKILSKQFGTLAYGLVMTRLPGCYSSYYKALDGYKKNVNKVKENKCKLDHKNIYNLTLSRDNLIKKIVMLVATHSFFIQFFESINFISLNSLAKKLYLDKFVKNLSKCNMLLSNKLMIIYYLFSLKNNLETYLNYSNLESKIDDKKLIKSEKMKTIIDEHKNLALINIVKAITSLTSQIIAFSEMAVGITLASSTTALALSTLGVILAISSYIYSRSLSYEVTYLSTKDSDSKQYVKDDDIKLNLQKNKLVTQPVMLTA
jgi:hypothetical protein